MNTALAQQKSIAARIRFRREGQLAYGYAAALERFQPVDAAQKCAFAGTARTDNTDDISGLCPQGYSFQHFVVAEFFVEILNNQLVQSAFLLQVSEPFAFGFSKEPNERERDAKI